MLVLVSVLCNNVVAGGRLGVAANSVIMISSLTHLV